MTYVDTDDASVLQRDLLIAGQMATMLSVPSDPALSLFIYTVDQDLHSKAGGVIGIVALSYRQSQTVLRDFIWDSREIPATARFNMETSFPVSNLQIGILFSNVYFHKDGV